MGTFLQSEESWRSNLVRRSELGIQLLNESLDYADRSPVAQQTQRPGQGDL